MSSPDGPSTDAAPPRSPSAWPQVEFESRAWHRTYSHGEASRTQLRRHAGPYRAAVVPRIASVPVQLSPGVATGAADAAAEIARFDVEVGQEIAPCQAVLLRSESAASSQIENLTASARAIAEAVLHRGRVGGNAAAVLANTDSMTAAIHLADRLDADAILAMHHTLMKELDADIAGRWRDQQVWVGGGYLGPHAADFVPPHHDRVPAAIDDLVDFMRRDDIPVLAHAALAHAQFETIHPFSDGNGRTGRALMHAMLLGKGLTRTVTVPVSAGLLVNVPGYFAALTAYRAGEPDAIVARVVDAGFAAVRNGRELVADLRRIRDEWAQRVSVRQGAATWRIVDLLLRQPVVDASMVSRELDLLPGNVYRALAPLVSHGILVETSQGRRDRVWRSPEVIEAIDAFAARAGRRALPGRP